VEGRLGGRVAVITGAGSGMGKAFALRWGAMRMNVVIGDIQEDALAAIFDAARAARATEVVGLMLLPPAADDPNAARPYFRALREVRDRLLARGVDPSRLRELSMGMSHDFEVAVEEGSTMVRVGTAIFGGRSDVRP